MRSAARQEVLAPLEAMRSLALYALSFGSVAGALLAWPWQPSRPSLVLGTAALGLAAAQVLGEGLAPLLLSVLDSRVRARIRAWVWVFYGGGSAMALVLAAAEPRLLRPAAALFVLLQGLFLIEGEVLGGLPLTLPNALVLVVLAGLRGGLPAAWSVTAYLTVLVVFLTFDHYARQLTFYPVGPVSLVGPALRQAASIAGPLALGLGVCFALRPPLPYAGLPVEELVAKTPAQLSEAYYRLLLLVLTGGVLVVLVGRLVRRQREDEPLREELLEAERGGEEALSVPTRGRRLYPGRRGRIVRAYVRLLAHARRLGWRLRPSFTPSDVARLLREPAEPVATLTRLFVGARYGPDEPGEADARSAEAAARAILARARQRRAAAPFPNARS